MSDLIARLEATDSVAHSDVCGCPGWFPPEYTTCRIAALLENLPAILRALKVQQAAETGVRADERREMQKAVAEAMAWSEHHRLQHGGCEWAVKGEQS